MMNPAHQISDAKEISFFNRVSGAQQGDYLEILNLRNKQKSVSFTKLRLLSMRTLEIFKFP